MFPLCVLQSIANTLILFSVPTTFILLSFFLSFSFFLFCWSPLKVDGCGNQTGVEEDVMLASSLHGGFCVCAPCCLQSYVFDPVRLCLLFS